MIEIVQYPAYQAALLLETHPNRWVVDQLVSVLAPHHHNWQVRRQSLIIGQPLGLRVGCRDKDVGHLVIVINLIVVHLAGKLNMVGQIQLANLALQ